jgi:hypothetical protein
VPEENLYQRYEDTIVVTDTGFENFTDFLPMELDDMERLVLERESYRKCRPRRRPPFRSGGENREPVTHACCFQRARGALSRRGTRSRSVTGR